TPAQDRGCFLVAPVVDHPAEHIHVTAGGKRIEKALPHEVTAPVEVSSTKVTSTTLDRLGQVDQGGAYVEMSLEYCGQQRPGATADVDDVSRARPVIAIRRVRDVFRPGGHGRVE